jgi:peptidoglycan/xylan/chitin deacetylase (PgdA/CDA1 family)
MVATFYIVSGFVGQPGYMSWDEIRALHAAGMEIGSHTVTHPDLTTLGLDQIRGELAESRAAIEAAIGAPVTSFCYPAGRFDDDVAALAQEAGYLNATTTMPDLPEGDLMRLPRLRVEGSYGAAEVGWLIP